MKIASSLIQYILTIVCPPYISLPVLLTSLLPRIPPPPSYFQKRAGLQEMTTKPGKTRYCLTRQNPHIESGQGWKGSPTEGKESKEQAKESEAHKLPLIKVPQKQQANSYKYSENLLLIPAGLEITASVSVKPHESSSGDLVEHVLLASSIPPDSYNLSSGSSAGYSNLQEEGPPGALQFRLSLHNVLL